MARYRAAAMRLALQPPADKPHDRATQRENREQRTSTGASLIAARLGPARQKGSNRAERSEAGTRRLHLLWSDAFRKVRPPMRMEVAITRAAVPGALRATTCPRWSENRGSSSRPFAKLTHFPGVPER